MQEPISLEGYADDEEIEGLKVSTLRKAKGNHKAWLLKTDEGAFLVRRPLTAEFDRAISNADPESGKLASAMRTLAVQCVLYPEKSELRAILEEQPGLGVTLGNQLMQLAGLSKNVEIKKL